MSRSLACLAVALIPALVPAAETIGAETCKACHPAAYEVWRDSRHARAGSDLPEKNRNDARCTGCHSPQQEKVAAGVTCETCHGPGQYYAQSYVMRDKELSRALGLVDPGEKTCAACHTDTTPSLVRFDYQKKLMLIEHHEPALRSPARPAPPQAPKERRAPAGKTS